MDVKVQELIDSGVHFGCHVSRWNPKMAGYIQARRNLIHIIDLRETLRERKLFGARQDAGSKINDCDGGNAETSSQDGTESS